MTTVQILTEIQRSPRYEPTRRFFRALRWVLLPWESLLGVLGTGAVVGFFNGVQLLLPTPTFAASPSYVVLQRMIPEPVLGWLLVIASIAGLLSMMAKWSAWQVNSCAALSLLFIYLAAGLYPTSPAGLGWVTYAGLAACLAISVIARLWRESLDGA